MSDAQTPHAPEPPPRRAYQRPAFVEYGSVEALTAGTRTTGGDGAAGGRRNEQL
ncbi:MAG TPA: lasso RiPP family leader peptide-containing protein [Vicinamibacterales bacterium]|nr:lasso RiPP family leader peptide-containing protein [Vicinamibacterales bacterium]